MKKNTKVTKIKRAAEKPRRFDDAIRWLRDEARRCAKQADMEPACRPGWLLDAASMSAAASALEDARD